MAAISLSAPVVFGQSRVFYDGFEDGTANKWAVDGSHPKGQVITQATDGGTPRSGTRFLSLNWHSTSHSAVTLSQWPYTREMFIRMWWRLDADVDGTDGAKMMRMGYSGTTSDTESIWARESRIIHQSWYVGGYESSNLVRNCWSSVSFDDRKWHKVEIYIKHDTNNADGVIKLWFDGNTWAGINSTTGAACYPVFGNTFDGSEKYWPLYLPSNWSPNPGWEHDMNNHFYVDDVEIYSDQGSGAAGSMADATINVSGTPPPPTAPAAPTNLRIVK
jgi:hypothetical protein